MLVLHTAVPGHEPYCDSNLSWGIIRQAVWCHKEGRISRGKQDGDKKSHKWACLWTRGPKLYRVLCFTDSPISHVLLGMGNLTANRKSVHRTQEKETVAPVVLLLLLPFLPPPSILLPPPPLSLILLLPPSPCFFFLLLLSSSFFFSPSSFFFFTVYKELGGCKGGKKNQGLRPSIAV